MKQKLFKVEVFTIDSDKVKNLIHVTVYSHFRRALNDVLNGNIISLSNEIGKYDVVNYSSPMHICFTSMDNQGRGDDMTIKYKLKDGEYLVFYIGELIVIDGKEY